MQHKYLIDTGIKENDLPWLWCPGDARQEQWRKQQAKYGFDERETWSLNYAFRLWFYERLKMYNEINCIDTSFYKFEYDGVEYTQQECMDFILAAFEKTFKDDNWDLDNDTCAEVYKAYQLVAKILPALWW